MGNYRLKVQHILKSHQSLCKNTSVQNYRLNVKSHVQFAIKQLTSCPLVQDFMQTTEKVGSIFANLPMGIYHGKIKVFQNHMPFGTL